MNLISMFIILKTDYFKIEVSTAGNIRIINSLSLETRQYFHTFVIIQIFHGC